MNTKLKSNRSLLKFILLSIITFGIYTLIFYSKLGSDLNKIATKYDGKITWNYVLVSILSIFTLGIPNLIWYYSLGARLENELKRRNLEICICKSDFWIWYFLGSIIIIGPYIYIYKIIKSINLIVDHYNNNDLSI